MKYLTLKYSIHKNISSSINSKRRLSNGSGISNSLKIALHLAKNCYALRMEILNGQVEDYSILLKCRSLSVQWTIVRFKIQWYYPVI